MQLLPYGNCLWRGNSFVKVVLYKGRWTVYGIYLRNYEHERAYIMYNLGIIGFGVVGKSILSFLRKYHHQGQVAIDQDFAEPTDQLFESVEVWDKRPLDATERALIQAYGAHVADSSIIDLTTFVASHDYVIASPGVDVSACGAYQHKVLCELDFFANFFKKPTIAITGSLGKTTTTKLIDALAQLLPVGQRARAAAFQAMREQLPDATVLRPWEGGNIGTGMLDLISEQDNFDCAILELSSFQLERSKKFASDIAVWTNFYPNHLDRHKTLEQYFEAKLNLFLAQRADQVAIMSSDLLYGPIGDTVHRALKQVRAELVVCSQSALTPVLQNILPERRVTFITNEQGQAILQVVANGTVMHREHIITMADLPPVTFASNWLQVIATLYAMGLDLSKLASVLHEHRESLLSDLQYRVRHFATVRGVDFYDDSKSTIAQATLAAVHKIAEQGRPINLIIGGLGKGVDRSWLMEELQQLPAIKRLFCFGPECAVFAQATAHATLESVMGALALVMEPGEIVLFSPSGTSFDFFRNYEHRGQVFESLVKKLAS